MITKFVVPKMSIPDRFISIDLECLSLSKAAPILTLGVAIIDRTGNQIKLADSAYFLTDFWKDVAPSDYDQESGVLPSKESLVGLLYDEDRIHENTYDWWRQQDPEAIREAFAITPRDGQIPVQMQDLYSNLHEFLARNGATDIPVYGFGATFDNAIMEENAFLLGVQDAWTYRNSHCGRTLQRTLNSKDEERAAREFSKLYMKDILGITMLPHVAVHDAIAQGIGIAKSLNDLATVRDMAEAYSKLKADLAA